MAEDLPIPYAIAVPYDLNDKGQLSQHTNPRVENNALVASLIKSNPVNKNCYLRRYRRPFAIISRMAE